MRRVQECVVSTVIHVPNKMPKDIFCQVRYEAKELAVKNICRLSFAVDDHLAAAKHHKPQGVCAPLPMFYNW